MQARVSPRSADTFYNKRRLFAFVLFGLVPLAVLMAPKAEAAAYSATASVTPSSHYLNDTAGTVFRFTVKNTGTSAGIGAVEILRPATGWHVTGCPTAPLGWSAQASDTKCRYRSKTTTSDDIKPGRSSSMFSLRATSLPGAENRASAWKVTVSRTDHFSTASALIAAPAATPGALNVTAHSFQILDAGIAAAAATPGAPCPTLSREAITGTSQDVVVCGRNRTTGTLTPTAANSSLAGTWIGTPGTFASGPVAPGAGSVVLGTWDNAALTSVFGNAKTVIAAIGSASNRTSPSTTLLGYNATNRPPVALAGSGSTLEDTVSGAIALSATDDDGDTSTFAIATGPAHGTLSAITAGPCSGSPAKTCGATVKYTPAANYNGADSFTYTASDPYSTSAPVTVTLAVTSVNDEPTFTKGANQAVNEDAPAQTIAGWATAISTGPANESGQAISGTTVTNNNNGLFAVQPALSPSGALTYTPAPNANGAATVSVSITDDGGTANGGDNTSPVQTFTVTVAPVNDEPSFTKGADANVLEDSGPRTISAWATGLSTGPANEAGQTAAYTATNSNTSLFSVQPAVNPAGDLTFTPAANGFGTAVVSVSVKDNGGTANGGDDTSPTQTFTITVTPVNDEPTFAKGANQGVNEDAGPQTVTGWATAISTGPANESGQAISGTTVTNNNNGLFVVQPALSPSGALTYTPAPNANGAATVSVSITDNGGTANGGDDTSPVQTFTITVGSVNDEPSFTKGGDQNVLEDSGAQTANGWATGVSTGPADEAGQTWSYQATNDNNGLFAAQPAVSPAGVLTYTPAANQFGTATVSVSVKDNGGTANGGDDTSPAQTFTITVNPVNDEPSFTKGANQAVNEDSGARTVAGWATAISTGPANEAGQAISGTTVTNDNNGLFSAQPALSPAGTLTYTPAPNAVGAATVSVAITDNGGTANGGDNTSQVHTFTITVNPVNDEPTFTKGANQAVLEDSGPRTVSAWATGLSAGPADEAGQSVSYSVTNNRNALFSVQPDVDEATGNLTFTPAANQYGTATVTVTATDNGGTANGGDNRSSQTFTITVTAVNDEPSFTKGADQSVNEDSGAKTVNGWATALSAGPNETQALTFNATNDNNGLFAVQPAISPAGVLTYTPAQNANGAATITVTLSDNGGTANGGDNTSPAQTFTITVGPVNDAPSFTKGADRTVNEDSSAHSEPNWATAISKGPADESAQTLSFTTSNTNNSLFSVQPGVTPAGTLVFTPAPNAFGNATVTISLSDTGGTANGGDDTSDEQTFTITVDNINDAPSFSPGANQAVNEDSGAKSVEDWASNMSGGPNESDTVTLSITANDNPGLFSAGPALANDGTLTYTPAANKFGVANLTATADDGKGQTSSHNFTITVNAVNDNPSFTGGLDQTVDEDSGAKTVTGWASNISPGPNESDAVTLSVTANDNPSLFSAGPAVSNAGDLTFTPAANATGVANLTVTADDGQGGTASDSLVITVTQINDEPSFTKGAEPVVVVNSGPQTIPGWATNISGGPNESGQTLTFQLFEEDGDYMTAGPTLDPVTGDLSFTPGNKLGTELVHVVLKDNGGTANGGDDTLNTSFTMQFVPANATPVAQNTSANGNEDGGAMTVTLTGTDADDDDLTFTAGTATNGLVTVPGAVDCTTVANTCTTTVTYTPNADFNGSDSFTYTVNDGTATSAPATAAITVNAVNDEPSFTKGGDQTVNEDAGAQTVNGWATNRSVGPANESSQTLTIERVGTTNNALFSALPSVDAATGNLTYTPAANAHGSATVTLRAKDTGGTANGGDDTGPDQNFTITVNPVNDVPVATDDSQTTNEDTHTNLAVKGNDTDADNDSLSFHAFDAASAKGAAITDNGDGTLKYNPAGVFDHLNVDEADETDTFTYTIKDGNGGTDTATVTITVTPVNDAPQAQTESQTGIIGNTVHAVSTSHSGPHTSGTGELDDGVVDPDDTVFTLTAAPVATANSGTATINADGTYTYLPPQGYTGSDTFTFTVNDAHGGSDTETATMTVANMVWYVDNAKASAGDGRSSSPFNTIAPLHTGGSADAKDDGDDHIFVYSGTAPYTGGLLLEGTQKLWGQPKGLTVAGTSLVAAGSTNPTLNGGLTLANNTDTQAVDLGAATMALSGTSVGSSTVGTTHNVNINNPSGGGISLNTGTPTVTVNKLTTTGGTHGINLSSLGGTVTVNDPTSSISSPTTAGVSVGSSNGSLTYPGSVTASGAARSVAVTNKTGGTVALSGAITDNGTGVSLTNNTGAVVNLSGELTLTTTTNPAFTATGGGTVTASHLDNEIVTTSGTGVNIVNTTIGANDVKFKSVNVNAAGGAAPANGIIVNNTGSSGGFEVLGVGTTAGSGGTIRGTTGVGVSLTSTRDVALSRLKVQDTLHHGIQGSGVTNLTLTGVEVPGAGDADNERAADLTNIGGTLTIAGGSYSDASDDLVKLANTNTNVTVNVNSNAQFKDLTQTFANNAIQLEPNGTSAITATITGNTFSNLKNSSTMLGAATLNSSGTSSLVFTNNTVSGGVQGGAGVFVSGQENTTSTVTITGNSFTGAGGNGVVNHDVNDSSNVWSTITNNTFTSPKGHGIVGAVDEDADTRMRIENNTITNAGGDGIELTNFGDDSPSAMTSTAHFIVRNNTVNGHSLTSGVQFVGGIGIFHFENDADATCAAVTGNTVQNTPAGFFDIYFQDNGSVNGFKYEENPNTPATGFVADSYIHQLNPNTTLANVANSGAVYSNGTTCTNP